jgi:hypothetical protein
MIPRGVAPGTRWSVRSLIIGAVALAIAFAGAGSAEHALPFRFVVLGFVTDTGGRPVADHPILVVREKTGLAYRSATDASGFYVVVLRLGDESAGEPLTLSIGPAPTVRIVARFDPANHADERGTRVDLVAGRVVERAQSFRPTLREFLRAR